jgi:molecular chaperone GrpE (heat shock protein)
MDVFNWLGDKLGINELRKRLDNLEARVTSLEHSTGLILDGFGNYKNRTSEELKLMESQISKLLDQIDNVLSTLDNKEGIERARNLRRRLTNNKTRIYNAMRA